MAKRVEVKCLSPLEWKFGWVKSFFVFAVFIVGGLALHARANGYDFSVALAIAGSLAVVSAFLLSSKVTLLEDGLAYQRFGFTKFIPYSKIRDVELVERLGAGSRDKAGTMTWTVYGALRLHFDGHTTYDIGTSSEELFLAPGTMRSWSIGQYGSYGALNPNGRELEREIDGRLLALREARPRVTPMAEGLLRGEKSIAAWLAAIEAAAPAKGDAYRGAAGAHEALWRVLEDETSPREARAAAALALRSHLGEEGRSRMRVVVDTCESPKLRVAIETALDEEAGEERLLHALEQASLPREES